MKHLQAVMSSKSISYWPSKSTINEETKACKIGKHTIEAIHFRPRLSFHHIMYTPQSIIIIILFINLLASSIKSVTSHSLHLGKKRRKKDHPFARSIIQPWHTILYTFFIYIFFSMDFIRHFFELIISYGCSTLFNHPLYVGCDKNWQMFSGTLNFG